MKNSTRFMRGATDEADRNTEELPVLREGAMKDKDIWLLIIGALMVVSAIVQFFNADLGATLFVYITLILAGIGLVYLWRY